MPDPKVDDDVLTDVRTALCAAGRALGSRTADAGCLGSPTVEDFRSA
jgi:hypothetical protein